MTALTGGSASLVGLDGHSLDIPLTDVIVPGSTKVVQGQGMPISKTGGQRRGDLHITFEVEFPKHLSNDKKQQLRRILAA